LLTNQLLNFREFWGYKYKVGTMKERDRLMKARYTQVFYGNRQRFFHSEWFLVMVSLALKGEERG
jgi:hypothetical protein